MVRSCPFFQASGKYAIAMQDWKRLVRGEAKLSSAHWIRAGKSPSTPGLPKGVWLVKAVLTSSTEILGTELELLVFWRKLLTLFLMSLCCWVSLEMSSSGKNLLRRVSAFRLESMTIGLPCSSERVMCSLGALFFPKVCIVSRGCLLFRFCVWRNLASLFWGLWWRSVVSARIFVCSKLSCV